MAVDPVAVIVKFYDCFNRKDWDGLLEPVHPEATIEDDAGFSPNPQVYHGHAGVLNNLQSYYRIWPECHVRIDHIWLRGDTLVVADTFRGRGGNSGVELDGCFGHLGTFEGDKVIAMTNFRTPEEALAASGLGPEDEVSVPAAQDPSA